MNEFAQRNETPQTAVAATREGVISNLLRLSREMDSGKSRLFCEVAARLVERLGTNDNAISACLDAAHRISAAIHRREPFVYPPSDDNCSLEHPDFRQFQDLCRTLLPLATQIRDWERGYIRFSEEQDRRQPGPRDFFRGLSEQRIRSLDALVETLTDCNPPPPAKRQDPRSHWHAAARNLASWIEAALKRAGIETPSRNSALSPLVLAVHDLLGVVGVTQAPDAIRKVLGKSR